MGHREEAGMFYSDNDDEENRVGEDEEDDTPQVRISLYGQMPPLKGKIL